MTAEANGAQIAAHAAALGTAVPYGDGEGRGQAPPLAPPPPLNALGSDVAQLRREVGIISEAVLQLQDRQTGRQSSAKRRELPAKVRQFPKRYAVPLCIAGAMVVTYVGVGRLTPEHSEADIASRAALVASSTAEASTRAELEAAKAAATRVVVPDPFDAYGLELTEDAKTAIGWSESFGNRVLHQKRAEFVAAQVRANVATMPLLTMRLTSIDGNTLKVTDNKAVGFPLFQPPPVETAPPATTATSAP